MAKPTLRQKIAFKKVLELMLKQEPIILRDIMKKSGYSDATAINPTANLTGKTAWKELLAKIDEEPLLDKLRTIALDDDDKRSSITAIQELLKLLDKYPKDKSKIIGLFERIDNIT